MDLTISSEKIGSPLLVELLRKLIDSFNKMDKEFYVRRLSSTWGFLMFLQPEKMNERLIAVCVV